MLKINTEELKKAWSIVSAIVPRRSPKPSIMNAKLAVSNGQCSLIGTDMEISVKVDIPCESDRTEVVLLPNQFGQIVKDGDEFTELAIGPESIEVRLSEDDIFTLATCHPDDFPDIDFGHEDWKNISGEKLALAINRTVFCTDAESTRYALGGVLFEPSGDLAATDSRRLAVCSIGTPIDSGECSVVPAKACKVIAKIADGEDVQVSFTKNSAKFTCENVTLVSRLIEGRFPKYQQVIPACNHTLSIDRDKLIKTLRRSTITTDKESRGVQVEFGEDSIRVLSKSETGNASLLCGSLFDDPAEVILLDPRFVIEAAASMSEAVQVEYTNSQSPVLIRDGVSLCVVMPLAKE